MFVVLPWFNLVWSTSERITTTHKHTEAVVQVHASPPPHFYMTAANRVCASGESQPLDSLLHCVEEDKVSEHDTASLEHHTAPGWVAEVVNLHYCCIHPHCHLREDPLKPGKQWGVIQGPLRCVLQVSGEEEEEEGHMIYCMQCGNGLEHQQLQCNLQMATILNSGHMLPWAI